MALQEFKCPSCGGTVKFNTDKQKMVCDFCGTEYEIENENFDHDQGHSHTHPREKEGTTKTITTESGTYEHDQSYFSEEEEEGLKVYSCNSCGGEIVGDETIAATSCPFCNNNVVVPSQFEGDLKPDFIIPFKLDKDDAKKALKKFYNGRRLLPKVFKDQNHIEEIKGIYVPFWLFSGDAHGEMVFRGTKIRTYSDSVYRYTETSYYEIERDGTMNFRYVPVDGSSKLDDVTMQSIEPYKWEEAMNFSTQYLPGFLANRYDVEAKEVIGVAEDRIKNSTMDSLQNSISGYSSLNLQKSRYNLGKVDIHYALVPVWFLNTEWQGKFYAFVMNGQTGKIVGDDMPVDNRLRTKKLLTVTLILGVILFIIAYLVYPYLGR